VAGTATAAVLFGLALLASGQSSTFTGTIAGQVIMEGFLNLKIPCWQRRLITRVLALGPAMVGVLTLGDHAIGKMLVGSQVVLSLRAVCHVPADPPDRPARPDGAFRQRLVDGEPVVVPVRRHLQRQSLDGGTGAVRLILRARRATCPVYSA
jgi:hypothetical protein